MAAYCKATLAAQPAHPGWNNETLDWRQLFDDEDRHIEQNLQASVVVSNGLKDAHPWTLLKSFKIALFQPAHLNNVFAATFFHATLKDLIIQLSAAKCSQVET